MHIDSIGTALLVSWSPPTAGSVSYYVIERMTSAGLAPPVTVSADTTSYLDEIDAVGVVGAAYEVTAVHTDDNQASASAAAIFVGHGIGPSCYAIRIDISNPGGQIDPVCVEATLRATLEPPAEDTACETWWQVWSAIEPILSQITIGSQGVNP